MLKRLKLNFEGAFQGYDHLSLIQLSRTNSSEQLAQLDGRSSRASSQLLTLLPFASSVLPVSLSEKEK